MASSSLAMNSCDNYDVFLSFRGEDTRYNFISYLHKSLVDHNFKVFIDYNIRRGQEITVAIERVIEGAKMSIIVFSKNYADSTFCLDELLKIMECRESKAQIVLPIFYKVEPLEDIYEKAFESHEKETTNQGMKVVRWKSAFRKALGLAGEPMDDKKVAGWKSAFRKALGLAGEPMDDKSNEAERIEKITTEVLVTLKEMNNSLPKGEELKCALLVGQSAENNLKNIWECLMDDKISRVGIYGMGGVGKTTIATHINNQILEVANPFTHIYWLTVSKELSIYNLQSDVAKKINLDLSKVDDEKRRAAIIQKELSNQKFVLILDDVWEAFEIEDVGIPPLVDGQKLFMTSRSCEVCQRMECEPIQVKPLTEEDAFNLFIKESKHQMNDSLEWEHTVGSIVKECGGLPLAIVVVGRIMRGVKEIWKWRDTVRELQKPCEGENPEIEKKVFKVLKFSYDRLPSDRCQQCFLYCSLFPEDHLFYREDLIEYWIGEGLINIVDSRPAELDKGNVILDELIHASLLEAHDDTIKMHDVIRDMAHKIVKFGLQFEERFENVQVLEMLKSFRNSTPQFGSRLKTLVLKGINIRWLSGCVFAKMQSLNVLHISYMGILESIPDCISNLVNLRLLIIEGCYNLKCIPSLGGLGNLRHLKISSNDSIEEIPKGIGSLDNLKELHIRYSGVADDAGALISLEKLETLHVCFRNLKKLHCYIKSGHWRRLLEYHIQCGQDTIENWRVGDCLKTMSFLGIKNVKKLGMFLPDNIQYLQLQHCDGPMSYYFKNRCFVNLQCIYI